MADKQIVDLNPKLSVDGTELIEVQETAGGPGTSYHTPLSNLIGPEGPQGIPGDPGADGSDGAAATADAGDTTTLAAGSPATVTNSGTPQAAVFDFGIPQGIQGVQGDPGADSTVPGPQGDPGDPGDAATVTVGTTTTLAPGSDATVTNVGSPAAAIFDFGIPEGEQGASGAGTGDVNGPAVSSVGNIALYNNSTGDLLKDDGVSPSDFATSVQGGKADSALQTVIGGTGITVDATDPQNPTINADGGGGQVDTVVAGAGVSVNSTDPINPVVSSPLANTALQPNADITELTNNAGYLTTTTGDARYYTETEADGLFATAAQGATADTATQPGDNVSTLTNDAGYLDDATAFASAAQGLLADTATQPGDNVSTLTNDAGYKAYYSGAALPDPAGYDEGDLFCVTA